MTSHRMNRRQVLRRVGTAGVLGASGLSSGAGAEPSSTRDEGPVRARGRIEWKYEYTPDTLTVEEWYVSPDLERRYGTARMLFERTVYDRDEFPRTVDESLPDHGTRVATTRLDKLVGTESEWATHIESRRKSGGGVGISNHSDYQGPIWEYDKNDDGYYTKTAPVNIVWETENTHNLSDIVNKLKEGDFHGLGSCAHTKYVYISSYGFVSQDEQVGTQDYCGDAQDHVRMWYDRGSFGAYYGQFEIGSIHHDPAGHDFGCCCDSFTFEPPEDRMRDYWRNNSNASYVGSIDLDNAKDWASDCKEANDDWAAYIEWNS